MFIIFGEGLISGTVEAPLSYKSLRVQTSVDKALKRTLVNVGDYTLLQFGGGTTQEMIKVVRTETGLDYIRNENESSRFDHPKGTSVKFTNNVYVTVELLECNK